MLFKSAAAVQPANAYANHELRVLFDNTVGQIDYWLNGVNLFSDTGIDTIDDAFGGSGAWRTVELSTNGPQCLDDLYVVNGDGTAPTNATVSIGPWHVTAGFPQTDAVSGGDLREMTPSTGADHGAMVDEDPPNYDVDYLASNVEGQRELFRFPQIAVASPIVYAVQKGVFARLNDIGHGEVSMLTKSSLAVITESRRTGLASDADDSVPQTSNYHYYIECDDRQGDASAWTLAALNASQFGMRHYTSFS